MHTHCLWQTLLYFEKYRQDVGQLVDHEVDKLDIQYTQSNAWLTEDVMT